MNTTCHLVSSCQFAITITLAQNLDCADQYLDVRWKCPLKWHELMKETLSKRLIRHFLYMPVSDFAFEDHINARSIEK